MLAPRYGRGNSALAAVARSIASLMATLIRSIDRWARLRSSIRTSSKTDLVVEFVWRHQRSAGRRVGLARDHLSTRLASDALVAEIARDHGLAGQPHGGEQ